MKQLLYAFILGTGLLIAQPNVAPSSEPVGSTRGDDFGLYNIRQSFEAGYRFRSVGGNEEKFRSDVNYGNGIRLLGSSFSMQSKEGRGKLFDELLINTIGLGNDPYQFASLRVAKNKLYRYDMSWRLNDYFNPALTIANGLHAMDTEHQLQDHDLTLLPQSRVRFFFGYTRNSQSGPALSTVQLFDSRGDEFPLFTNIDRKRNEYRFGNELNFFGFRLNWIRGWDRFEENSPQSISGIQPGANPNDTTQLNSFSRNETIQGQNDYWRVGLFRDNSKVLALNGRFTYTAGRNAFALDESAIGTGRFGAVANRQILTYGNARRPVATGNLNLTLLPASRFSFTNQTSVYNVRMEGNSYYKEVNNGDLSTEFLPFQYLGILTVSNSTILNARLNNHVGMYGGYQFSTRRIGSVQTADVPGFPSTPDQRRPYEQTNTLHAGTAGVRWRPVKPLVFLVNAEIGRADRPIYPTSDRNYHAISGRVEYKQRNFRLAAWSKVNYNFNSVSLASFASRSRQYAGDGTWLFRPWMSFDAGYTKQHLDTAGAISYFYRNALVSGEQSLYFSNLHTAYVTAHFVLRNRIDLFVGYHRVQDVGDGRSNPLGNAGGSALDIFRRAQTFPLTYQSPMARLSFRIRENIRWNAGYQYYGYGEEFQSLQNYRAHTGYTGVQWSF
jgi:hypothetical protein